MTIVLRNSLRWILFNVDNSWSIGTGVEAFLQFYWGSAAAGDVPVDAPEFWTLQESYTKRKNAWKYGILCIVLV